MYTHQSVQIEDVLRQGGFKVTPARLLVLKAMLKAKSPLSVQEIYESVEGHGIDRVTVYRTVKSLTVANIIQQINFHHRHALFEFSLTHDHHHVVCIKCDRMVDVEEMCGDAMDKQALQKSGFATIAHHSLEFFGLCKQCAR